MLVKAGQFYRTCQECGHVQLDTDPKGHPTVRYTYRTCKVCKSEALDYGTTRAEDWKANEQKTQA